MRSLIALSILVGAGLIGTKADAAPGDGIYARPGVLVAAKDGAQLNLVCMGQGSPAVIFESGFLDWAPAWAIVQPRIAQFTRACSYDRTGSGFSGPAVGAVTLERTATELRDALDSAGVQGPYILVGNASGGNHARAFADMFPEQVAGLVMVEADASDVDAPENRKSDDDGILGFVPLATACRNAVAAGNADAELPADSSSPGPQPKCASLFFRGLPDRMWSPGLNAKLLELGGHNVAMWDAAISEASQIPAGEIWLLQHRRTLGSTPIIILTTGNHGVHFLDKPARPTIEHLKYEYDRAVAQSQWLGLSTDSKQIFVRGSGEYIEFDQPDVVVDAVREVYEKAKRPR
jgi:pimeloyl-ACP methyl ester carboxylesterase